MNKDNTTAIDRFGRYSLLSTSAIIAVLALNPVAAHAQDSSETISESDEDEVIATGIKQSLKEARDLKRDADTAVDSITASDVSTLPDLSVAEALARVPGVVAQRFDITDNNGGDFPSPEGGGNLIRGLSLVRSEFNGRDAFSANGGRSLDFGTIPPELIGAVDVYKNTTADQIEGGIGGSINLRTLEPFDRPGLIAVATLDGTYTDLRDEVSPDFSAIVGNRWDTSAGEFGLLGSFSRSELKSRLDGFQIGQVIPVGLDADNNVVASDSGVRNIALPSGFQMRTNQIDRERDSYYVAGQWRDTSGDLQITAKYSLIENQVDGDERTLEFFADGESAFAYEFGDGFTTTPFTSAGLAQCNGSNDPNAREQVCEQTRAVDGLFESGLISNNNRDWTGTAGAQVQTLAISNVDKSKTDDLSMNIKWRPTDQLFVELDGHRTTAEFTRDRVWGGTWLYSDFILNADLDDPFVSLIPNPDSNPGGAGFIRQGATGATTSLADPANNFPLYAADEFRDNDGDMYALRADVEYEFDNDGWFDSVKFGARYADREQTNRQAGLNWAGVAPPWTGGYLPFDQLNGVTPRLVDFEDFGRGGIVRGNETVVPFFDVDLLRDYDAYVAALSGEDSINSFTREDGDLVIDSWRPLRQDGVVDFLERGSLGEVNEKVTNFYARLDFGQEFENGMALSGNVGLRYADAQVTGDRIFQYADIDTSEFNSGSQPIDFRPETVAFSLQPTVTIADDDLQSSERWLPSLNVKWDVNDEFLVRFAASEALTRPNIAQLNGARTLVPNFQYIFDQDAPANPDGSREAVDIVNTQISVFGGNPDLVPIESTNLDLSFEYYFDDSDSLTLSLFNKDIRNNIVFGAQTIGTEVLDGNEIPVIFNGDLNDGDASVRGFEIAYTQFYDQLPGLLSNLGVQANYTYLDAEAEPPAPFIDADGNGVAEDFQRILRYGVDDFLGLSDHAVNLIGIYEDEKLEMRLAYNWRSEHLSSRRDFVTGNPIFQEDIGYLDGSVKYDLTDNFQFRFQVANILDTKSKAQQQIDQAGQRFGRTSFTGDRRIRFGIRYAY